MYLKFTYSTKQENGLVSSIDFVWNIVISKLHYFGIFSSLLNTITSIINLINETIGLKGNNLCKTLLIKFQSNIIYKIYFYSQRNSARISDSSCVLEYFILLPNLKTGYLTKLESLCSIQPYTQHSWNSHVNRQPQPLTLKPLNYFRGGLNSTTHFPTLKSLY